MKPGLELNVGCRIERNGGPAVATLGVKDRV